MIKLYTKNITKWILNQVNNIIIWSLFFKKIYEYYIKLNRITNRIGYSDIDWIVICLYSYPFFLMNMDTNMDIINRMLK